MAWPKGKKGKIGPSGLACLNARVNSLQGTLRYMNYIADGNVNVITTLETGLAILFKTKKNGFIMNTRFHVWVFIL